jgi:hypothetical protein
LCQLCGTKSIRFYDLNQDRRVFAAVFTRSKHSTILLLTNAEGQSEDKPDGADVQQAVENHHPDGRLMKSYQEDMVL